MSDHTDSSPRLLSGSEARAFRALHLTPLNWAALVAAPFYQRAGRRPDATSRNDCRILEALRRELRTVPGLSDETLRLWRRFGEPGEARTVELAIRLFAWHLATDLTFTRREQILYMFGVIDREFGGTTSGPDAVTDLRLHIDLLLPCPAFPDDGPPPWVHVPVPRAEVLDEVQRTLTVEWSAPPGAPPADAEVPALARLAGGLADWWERVPPGRRAVERGAAVLSFAERERTYVELGTEWARVRNDPDAAGALMAGVREWIEAVRHLARRTAPLPVPGASAPRPLAAGADALALVSRAGAKRLEVEPGTRVGRGEYRNVFGAPDAGLAAADQFELDRDPDRGAWLVRPVPGTPRRTWYNGQAVPPAGADLTAGGVISVEGALELVVQLG